MILFAVRVTVLLVEAVFASLLVIVVADSWRTMSLSSLCILATALCVLVSGATLQLRRWSRSVSLSENG